MKYNIMIANSRLETKLHKIAMDEEEVRKRLANPIRTAESQAEYLQMPRQKQADIKDVGGFVAGTSADGSRKADQMISRCMIVYDIDKCTPDKFLEIRKQKQYKRYLYTTHKHTPDHPRFRLLYPLIKEVSAEAYVPVAIKLAQQLSILDLIDPVSLRPAQFMYFPSASRDGEYIYEEVDGAVVDADKLLACYTDWHNAAEWSQLLPVQMFAPKGKQAQDPCSKGGVIGAFCAAHSIDDAIRLFIPDIYRPSTIPGRYDYTRAESHAGLIVYDGKYAYSHHASDPACCGSLLNAFDLIRVHKFGALDVEEDWDCEARRYYIGIVGKYGPQVQKLLKVAATLDIQIICPLHGPVLTENLGHYIEKYDIWSSYKVEDEGVVIAYTSVYGNTKKAVEILAEKLKEKGCPKVTVFDLARDDMAEAVEDAFRYGKLVLATITYNADIFPFMKTYIDHLTERSYQNRTIGLIENGSWAPNAAKVMQAKFEKSKNITWLDNTVKIMSSLSDENIEELDKMAEELCK